ncbi:MAG: DUF1549 and DUF1553 domain-containing protein [Gemmataceae bacterium]
MKWLVMPGILLLLSSVAVMLHAEEPVRNPIDPEWAYHPLSKSPVPKAGRPDETPIDRFLLAKLEPLRLSFSPSADKATLIRRVTFDLTGLPPTPAEVRAFEQDRSPEAFTKVVERLLASPRFGERQATWWLDVVRFAETDGFKSDDFRPNAWRYRDYVIDSFNSNKPINRFIREQIAGDELFPDRPDALVATGFLRHYPDEYNAVNMEQRRQEILNDITDTTASAFLGLTVGCAKCHDHKTDPIPQSDFYRLQAFFAGYFPSSPNLLTGREREEYETRRKEWEQKTAAARKAVDEIEKPYREQEVQRQRKRHTEYVSLLDKPIAERTPLEQQLAAMVELQVNDFKMSPNRMKPDEKEKWEGLKKQIAAADSLKPPAAPIALAMSEVGTTPPPTRLLKRGNWRFPQEEIRPGYLSAIDDRDEDKIVPTAKSSGRRSKLAEWITSDQNPLTARVFVNRVWQQFFGMGIVATPADFGVSGERPSHPELLDWLAADFMKQGWSLKTLVRSIVLSAAYQQSSQGSEAARVKDPDNRLLSHMARKRLDGESIRDAILCVSAQLNLKTGGPGIYPELPAEMKTGQWKPSADVAERNRRSIYVVVKRNIRYPFFALFDSPDRVESCSRRFQTTTAPQALALLNDSLVIGYARQFANRIIKEAGSDRDKQIDLAFMLSLGRTPDTEERALIDKRIPPSKGNEFLIDLCHSLFNLNEFLYVD